MKVAFVGSRACAVISVAIGWRWMAWRGMFCLPHNIMVLMIALSALMFFSNISWFCVEIPYGNWRLRIMAMPASSANWWHCIFWWRSSIPSFPVAFSRFWIGAVTRGLVCARGSDGLLCITQYLQKPPICGRLYTSHVYFSNHEDSNTSFLRTSMGVSLIVFSCVMACICGN